MIKNVLEENSMTLFKNNKQMITKDDNIAPLLIGDYQVCRCSKHASWALTLAEE